MCFQTTKENIKKLPKTTEEHSKDEKERKGTKTKKNLEGKRGLQKLTERGEGAMGPVYGYFAPWLDHPRSDRSYESQFALSIEKSTFSVIYVTSERPQTTIHAFHAKERSAILKRSLPSFAWNWV